MQRLHQGRVYVDTNVFVYVLDRSERFVDQAERFLAAAQAGHFEAVTGDLAAAEALVHPYREAAQGVIESTKQLFFSDDGPVKVLQHPRAAYDLAAQIRGRTGAGMIDALHVATALLIDCTHLVTNDARMPSVPGLEVVRLQDLEELPG
jgi:predicted nucleic acid-binding protein